MQGADLYEGPTRLPESIAEMFRLEQLRVYDTLIKEIPDGILAALASTLRSLRIARNPELNLVSEDLAAAASLETLVIDSCAIHHLPAVRAARLTDFTVLRCKLENLDANTYIPSALRVSLAYNCLSAPPRALLCCRALVALNLESNEIEHLDVDLLRALTSLRSLNAKKNRLKEVDATALSQTLEVLELDNNYLEEIPRGLVSLVNLHYLSLKANQITRVPAEVLRKMRLLQDLHLDGNPLSDLLFGHLPRTAQRELQTNPQGDQLLVQIAASFLQG
ncbi:Leucine-rich repeat-containing protein 58 [Hondaea fermentalgiana]|uniref:Leucine-rich repeat-containing protein 58 n=1 Tax=Hondaea fermentalgiana TaxID=2315210 RepID=A0A2R5GPR3_9STRA|nr:Leucine-rich repeat-containing protein 58 [Hondaea fermentalgiana]|eukprot:GBG30613.1 Leucine-rich repeat-containing protein 58 [Hondaea fermentalgiana]